MATQLATLFLKRLGVPLVIRDLDQETVDRAVASIREELEGPLVPGRPARPTSTDFAGCDLVLEAVFEEMSIKQQVFAELRDVVGPGVHPRDEHVVALRRRDGRRRSACTSSTRSR